MAAHLRSMVRLATAILLGSALGGVALATEVRAQAQPADQITVAFDVSIAPSFLEPAETPGIGTPFVFLYALHDALIKPMPGNNMAPCLAESWTESPDGLTYEFKLREGLRFHNGDPFTAEDVKFSFHRYRGTAAKLLHERVKAVEIIDPHRVRFVLHAPWPDFLAFYATPATGAAWVVPKKHIERVGEEGFKKHPVGLGPYRFVRLSAGVELVLAQVANTLSGQPVTSVLAGLGIGGLAVGLAAQDTIKNLFQMSRERYGLSNKHGDDAYAPPDTDPAARRQRGLDRSGQGPLER